MKRIVLDTCVARNLCHEEPGWYSDFVAMTGDGWTFHLSDVAFAEIVAARKRGSLDDNVWQAGVARLDQLLCNVMPTLPGKRDLFHLCGIQLQSDAGPSPVSEDEIEAYSNACWEWLRLETLSDQPISFTSGGRTHRAIPRIDEAATALDEERTEWVCHMSRNPDPNFDYNAKVAFIKQDLDQSTVASELPFSVRGDIIAHAAAAWESRLDTNYNPSGNRAKNDGSDFLLLYVFLWPALLATSDRRLISLIAGLSSYQSGWIDSPDSIADKWKAGQLLPPEWPV